MARLLVWIILVVVLLAGQIGWLALLRGPRIVHSTNIVISGQIFLTAALLGMMALLKTTPPDAIRLSSQTSRRLVIGGAAALQIAVIALLWPGLSEDLVRYRLDGRLWLSGISPYATSPAEALKNPAFEADAIDRMVTYPEMHTIYPPVSQGVFALAALFSPSPGIPGEGGGEGSSGEENNRKIQQSPHPDPLPEYREREKSAWRMQLHHLSFCSRGLSFRIIFALCAVACTWLLIRLLERRSESVWWAALFGWSPLVTLETGGMGHQDILGVMFLLLTLYLADRRRYRMAAAVLALACGVKPFAIVLLPFLYRDARERERWAGRNMVGLFLLVIATLYLPAALYQRGYEGWLDTAQTYSQHWEANGSIYEGIKAVFGHGGDGWAMRHAKDRARLLAIGATFATLLLLWQFRASFAAAGYGLFFVLLLFSPVVYPWYLLWMLCFVPLLRGQQGWAGVIWAGTVAISYQLWDSHNWTLRPMSLAMEYVPVYATVLVECAWGLLGRGRLTGGRHR